MELQLPDWKKGFQPIVLCRVSCDVFLVHWEMPGDILHTIVLVACHRQGSYDTRIRQKIVGGVPVEVNVKEKNPFFR